MDARLFWLPHEESVWIPGQLKCGNTYITDRGEVTVPESDRLEEITDPEELRGVPDCCSLSHVSAASILHTVRVRAARGEIYTNVSNVLIAVNPFKAMDIYAQDYIEMYRGCEDVSAKPPHIFGLCAQAFAGLMDNNDLTNVSSQAVLISGESGAGKTETTKLVLLYTSEMLAGQEGGIEDVLMELNPILEAFGNAKTVRNNNSSRFGKWIQVCVDPASRSLRGVKVVDYLLEVTRVTGQGPGERNYHIFYQLAADPAFRKALKLEEAATAHYLRSNPIGLDGVDDARDLQDLRKALTVLEFSSREEDGIFRTVAALLHLGNVDFSPGGDTQVSTPQALGVAAELLGVDATALSKCMCYKRIATGKDVMMSPLDHERAKAARDSMAKMVYSLLFKWLVFRCNEALGKNIGSQDQLNDADLGQFIGVLDIAGFESFEKNLLEQLLINLSNEKLQNFFNNIVFTGELEEYKAEEVDIANIAFPDNSDVLALIEGPGGLLATLDDATTGVKQTDETFTNRLLQEKGGHSRLLKPKKFDPLAFGIQHYAGDVFYSAAGFLEKNVQSQPPEVVELLKSSSVSVLGALVREPDETSPSGRVASRVSKKNKATVGSAFKKSLGELMEKLQVAQCHFVRCIKPNMEKVPEKLTSTMVMDQLRLCGVMETVEIRKAGFLVRQRYADFVGRYFVVLKNKDERSAIQAKLAKGLCDAAAFRPASQAILRRAEAIDGQYALGKTKVLLKSPTFRILEDLRRAAFQPFAVALQRAVRGHLVRKQICEVREVHREILSCIHGAGHQLREEGFSAKQVHRATIAEGSLGHLDALLGRAINLPIKLGYIHEAAKVRSNIATETSLARKLATLAMQGNAFEMEEALANAEHFKLQGDLVDAVRKRLEDARAEAPIKQALQSALDSDEHEELHRAVEAATEKGYHEPKRWTQPSGAAVMKKAAERLRELDEERQRQKELRDALATQVEEHLGGTDLQAIQEMLVRAGSAGLQCEAVERLRERCTALKRETDLHQELQGCLASGDGTALREIVARIHAAGEQWLLPKLADDMAEAGRRIGESNSKLEAAQANPPEAQAERSLLAQVQAALEWGRELEPLLALQARFAEHLSLSCSGPKSKAAAAEEAESEDKLNKHIERLQEELSLIEELRRGVTTYTSSTEFEKLYRACDFGKWARGEEFWIRKEGWTIFQEFQERKDRLWKAELALIKLKGATEAFDCEEMEAAFTSCAELAVPAAEIEEYNKVFTMLQRPHQVRDLLSRWGKHQIRAANLQKQLEYLQAKEAGTESLIMLQLRRLKNSQSVELMRLALRKEAGRRNRATGAAHPTHAGGYVVAEQVDDPAGDRRLRAERGREPQEPGHVGRHGGEPHVRRREAVLGRPGAGAVALGAGREGLFAAARGPEVLDGRRGAAERARRGGLPQGRRRDGRADPRAPREFAEAAQVRRGDPDVRVFQPGQPQLRAGPAGGADQRGPRRPRAVDPRRRPQEIEAQRAKLSDKDTEIRRQLRELVKSTDIQAIKEILARATIYKVPTELTRTMEKRIEILEKQAGHLKDLRKCLQETDALVVAEAIGKVRRDHLDNPSNWELPEGPKVLSKVFQRKVYCEKVEDLEISVRRAARVCDVPALQNCLREAEELGAPESQFAEARQLLLSLQNGNNISRLINELRARMLNEPSAAEDPRVSQGIRNLVERQKQLGLQADSAALRDVSERIARGRSRSRGKSFNEADDAGDRGARPSFSLFEDLRNLKLLRDPLSWDTDAGNGNLEVRARAMVEFQPDKITASLTLCSQRQEIVSLQNFSDVLRCMGDKPCAFTGNKEDPIVRRLTISRRVCDEIYVQVMKQLTNNPSSESRVKGWHLLKRMVKSVKPSEEVYDFLMCFVQREAELPFAKPPEETATVVKKEGRALLAKAARRVMDENLAQANRPEAPGQDGQASPRPGIADIARMISPTKSTAPSAPASPKASQADEEDCTDGGSFVAADGTRSKRIRRRSLAAAAEERVQKEERAESRRMRMERQAAMAAEILDILTRD
mmetsp:Transcript_28826/g.87181  ORF Transcript_28826/g.87181 Transcript_28826/m.87181 type:complete len:2034 (-) Transcript_28826:176-6277(-)